MDVSRVTLGVSFRDHDEGLAGLVREIERLKFCLSQARTVDVSFFRNELDNLHMMALKMKSTYPTVVAYIEGLHNEMQTTEQILAQRSLQVDKLQLTVTRLQNDLTKLQDERKAFKAEVDRISRSALRRQIAVNIEDEVKSEMLTALSQDTSEENVAEAKLHRLRAQLLDGKKDVPGLAWLNFHDDDAWRKFTNAMTYMKAFSQEAHPTKLDGKPINASAAMELIDDEFDVSAVRRQKHAWDDELRSLAKRCVNILQERYRAPGETLLCGTSLL